jgi:hypothetical protein
VEKVAYASCLCFFCTHLLQKVESRSFFEIISPDT